MRTYGDSDILRSLVFDLKMDPIRPCVGFVDTLVVFNL